MNSLKERFLGKVAIVTGASGFIGAHLSRVLSGYGAKVVALVRSDSNLWRLKDILDDIELVKIDLLDSDAVKNLMFTFKPHFIFHFAIPGHGFLRDDTDLTKQIKVTNTHLKNLFYAINQNHITLETFVHACSGSIYEWNEKKAKVNEETPLKPATLRGKLKLAQRETCLKLAKQYNVPVRLARIFRVYGPQEVDTKLIVKALDAYQFNRPLPLGDVRFKRDYIYIDDLVEGLLLLAEYKSDAPIELNFGGENQYSALEIVNTLEQLMSIKIPKKLNAYPKNLYDQGGHVADCSKAYQVLDWKPSTELGKGLLKTIHWYQTYRNK